MKPEKKLVYVTGNHGKFEEVEYFIQRHAPEIKVKMKNLELDELQDLDQNKVASHKAQQAWVQLKQPLLVEDSGIFFCRYNKFPGTITKLIYEGIGFEGIFRLVEGNNRAFFKLQMIFVDGLGNQNVFEGRCDGIIVQPPRNEKLKAHRQLPYDDIFVPEGTDKNYTKLRGTEEYDFFGYRLKALKKFLDWYRQGTDSK
jgi:XTP/dITP diphosphohydrolase